MTDDERDRIEANATWKAGVDNHMKRVNGELKFAKGAALAGLVAIGSKFLDYISARFWP